MASSIQYLLEFSLCPRPMWPKAQHFLKWLRPQEAWPCDRWRRHGRCPQQFREELLPNCSLRCAGWGSGVGRGASRKSVGPAWPSGT